ncbi:MAG: phosphotransferase [Gammaproteobacteria bacterium]|nr:phosphotransferase [Gammaproteobacteria bacterium]
MVDQAARKAREQALTGLARNALLHWGLEGAPIALHSQSENTVFRVRAGEGAGFALRVHRPGYHDLGELESEHAWTSDLAAMGVAVPNAVDTMDGKAYATVAFPESDETRHVGLVEWIEATRLHDVLKRRDDDEELARCHVELGSIIADFHDATARWTPPPGFRRHAWDAEGLAGEAPFWGRFWEIRGVSDADRAGLLAIRNAVLARLSELPMAPDRYGMIHADLNLGNVLRAGERLVVIDFDDAGFGWFGFDLAVALWQQMDVLHERPRFAVARDALFAEYARRRRGSDDVLETVPLFLLMRTLMLLKWIEDRPEVDRAAAIPGFVRIAFGQAEALDI